MNSLARANVAVLGGGSFGTVLAQLVARNCENVRLWVREEERARSINATRTNEDYIPGMNLNPRIRALSDVERVFEGGLDAVVWALPSAVCRSEARRLAPIFRGSEIVIHATKGIEAGSLKRISEVLAEELPLRRIGVMSGPNLAVEIARGEPAGAVVASAFTEVQATGEALISGPQFRVYRSTDMIGVEWAGTLKNIFAIASGALDALGLGSNTRALMISRALAEMLRFGRAMGAQDLTFLGMAGVGDLIATCSSPLSRNYRVGQCLAKGQTLEQILAQLGSTAEGVQTTRTVAAFARERGIAMPITQGVSEFLESRRPLREIIEDLMRGPVVPDLL